MPPHSWVTSHCLHMDLVLSLRIAQRSKHKDCSVSDLREHTASNFIVHPVYPAGVSEVFVS